jgi:hypothetical protein
VPTALAIVGPTGVRIADNWADLLDGSIQASLTTAGVITVVGDYWYSGSNADGSLDAAANCNGWETGGVRGQYGNISSTTSTWMTLGGAGAICGQDEYHVLCLGW